MLIRPWRALLAAGAASLFVVAGMQAPSTANTQYPPTGASRVYKWGDPTWHDEFEAGYLSRIWSSNHPRFVTTHIGMLTLRGLGSGKPVVATMHGHSFTYGRWEVRLRVRQWNPSVHFPYRVTTQLVPARLSNYHCGNRNVTFADYTNGAKTANFASRDAASRQFTFHTTPYTSLGAWNTYAVEYRPHRITWFVDDHVVMTRFIASAVPAIPYALRFRIADSGPGSGTYKAPWMQMDWARYFTLQRPNALPITQAPSATLSTFANKC